MNGKQNSFGVVRTFSAGGRELAYFSLEAAEAAGLGDISRLPRSLKIVLENLLRKEDGFTVTPADIRRVATWGETRKGGDDLRFYPSRIVMPDSSGLPLLADLAAMRDAALALGGRAELINPMIPVDMVVDHSVIVESAGRWDSLARNMNIEYERNNERYAFLRWAQNSFSNLRLIPPGQGIVHQINLEFLSNVVSIVEGPDGACAVPDTVLGVDSHSPMINGIGVLGWGCGGIEAGAAMLGQPVSMTMPDVIGVRLSGALTPGVTSTDLALTMTEKMREVGVVQKFVEFFGPGLASLPVPIRATLANMCPEYGATIGYFPIDAQTLDYLRVSGRPDELIEIVEAYARLQGLWSDGADDPVFTRVVEFDLSAVEPSIAGPRRPQDRVPLSKASESVKDAIAAVAGPDYGKTRAVIEGTDDTIGHGDIAIAAITSCTNTSTPSVMFAAGLLARNAIARGLRKKPWVKTSLAPGSQVVAEYLKRVGLQESLDALGFQIVGFGCTTCMGNSGPLEPAIENAIRTSNLSVAAVLSGNRNFEGRVHPLCQLNYLASPPLVVAFALAGTLNIDLMTDPLGEDPEGNPVYLRDIWPDSEEIEGLIAREIGPQLYRERYADAYLGDERWQGIPFDTGPIFSWRDESLYIRRPPFFENTRIEPEPVADIRGARILAMLGSSITTDHISPVGTITADSSAGRYLIENGVKPYDFNSFAARRINHDVMIRGTFGNVRIRNELVSDTLGGVTRHMPDGTVMSMYDAAMRYKAEKVPLVVVAGADYGVGSSRDWAAKGTRLLGVKAVIAESFERIHRTNLIGMGVLPLQFLDGETRISLGLDGSEVLDITGLERDLAPAMRVSCTITYGSGSVRTIELICRLDTAYDIECYQQGGILPAVLRKLVA